MTPEEYFEYFAAQQVLRGQQLDPDEIKSGIVGGDKTGSDGGIDAFYFLVNGRMIRDPEAAESLRALKQNVKLELVIIQATTHPGFELTRLVRLKGTMENILTLDKTPEKFSEKYSESLLTAIDVFRTAHRVLMSKFPIFQVQYCLVTQGDTQEIAPDVYTTAKHLEDSSRTLLATIQDCRCEFVGARELIQLSTKPPKLTFPLTCVQSASSGAGAFVALVKLTDFYNFIRGDKGEFLTHLFESNVRDYQGDVNVNEAIRTTLEKPYPKEQFWWLNNGVTIVAEKVGGHPLELQIDEPQIVNGLQTSEEIFKYFTTHPNAAKDEKRELLVKVIGSSSDVHDHIIRATNSQTSIPAASLWATETIHRDIEQMFRSSGLYYDRRKNSWRRKGQPLAKVVGITELAQAVGAIYLREPNQARRSPSLYFRAGTHSKIFNGKFDIGMYVACAHIRKKTEAFLKTAEPDKGHRNNLLYYVMMAAAYLELKLPKARPLAISKINQNNINDSLFTKALALVRPIYEKYGGDDKAAKGAEFVTELRDELQNRAAKFQKAKKAKK
jgi:hypothetical protein